jgi:hypothetical protein
MKIRWMCVVFSLPRNSNPHEMLSPVLSYLNVPRIGKAQIAATTASRINSIGAKE